MAGVTPIALALVLAELVAIVAVVAVVVGIARRVLQRLPALTRVRSAFPFRNVVTLRPMRLRAATLALPRRSEKLTEETRVVPLPDSFAFLFRAWGR
jgi:hypothetical protein